MASICQFIEVVDSCIRCYNEKRVKISLGSRTPSNTDTVSELRHKTGPSFHPQPLDSELDCLQHATLALWRSSSIAIQPMLSGVANLIYEDDLI